MCDEHSSIPIIKKWRAEKSIFAKPEDANGKIVGQWRAVTSETSHAISIPKLDHEIGYFMGSQ